MEMINLENINFKINEGQIFGMLGPNKLNLQFLFNYRFNKTWTWRIKIAGEDVTNYPIYLRKKNLKLDMCPNMVVTSVIWRYMIT